MMLTELTPHPGVKGRGQRGLRSTLLALTTRAWGLLLHWRWLTDMGSTSTAGSGSGTPRFTPAITIVHRWRRTTRLGLQWAWARTVAVGRGWATRWLLTILVKLARAILCLPSPIHRGRLQLRIVVGLLLCRTRGRGPRPGVGGGLNRHFTAVVDRRTTASRGNGWRGVGGGRSEGTRRVRPQASGVMPRIEVGGGGRRCGCCPIARCCS